MFNQISTYNSDGRSNILFFYNDLVGIDQELADILKRTIFKLSWTRLLKSLIVFKYENIVKKFEWKREEFRILFFNLIF